MAERNCGTCKWLRVPTGEKRRKYSMFNCDVPRPRLPPIPASFCHPLIPLLPTVANMMCPIYGADCPTWERIPKKGKANG